VIWRRGRLLPRHVAHAGSVLATEFGEQSRTPGVRVSRARATIWGGLDCSRRLAAAASNRGVTASTLLWRLPLETGLRQDELCGLQWCDRANSVAEP
jgi:integrase